MRGQARLVLLFFVTLTVVSYVLFAPPSETIQFLPTAPERKVMRMYKPKVPHDLRPSGASHTYNLNFDPTDLQIAAKEGDSVKIFKSSMPDFMVTQNVDLNELETLYNAAKPAFGPECNETVTLRKYALKVTGKLYPSTQRDAWERFVGGITGCELYPEGSKVVEQLLSDMATGGLKSVSLLGGGTQVKFKLTFSSGKQGLFKPLRFNINYESHPNHFYFSDFERANAEIGAFHLDKVLKFRRTPPTVGRVLNLTEVRALSDTSLAKTFFVSPAKNLCFVGKCDYYCDTTHAICGRPDTVMGSVQMFMPTEKEVPRDHVKSLYRRSYSKRHQTTEWQEDNDFCEQKVKNHKPYGSLPRRLLDLVDIHIFDFLMGNLDRHHFEVLNVFDDPAYPVYFDNGRGFGRANDDFTDILAPLYQCCVVRASTVRTLLDLALGPAPLSALMRDSLAADPIAPVLAEKHLKGLDRRVDIVLRTVLRCIQRAGEPGDVLRTWYQHPSPLEESVDEESD